MRTRIVFKKTQAMRFTGHLDLNQTWMRVFRRAGIQLEYSQGFHQQPKLQLASALPLGYISSGEVLDAWIKEDLLLLDLSMKLQAALPPGLELIRVEEIPLDAPKVQVALQSADYLITLSPNENLQELQQRINQFNQSTEILLERRGKTRNIRDLVESLEQKTTADGKGIITMRLSARESATGRADEVLAHLGIDPYKSLIERISLNFA
jgi:radical SAM-linked protein